ncbi:MAG: lysophospholipid acyltransferase family protein, partial [Candidatus Neomarinimicrobiota bacterium]|nr:lysophospholipid acyltransferase family protein [Candidatus Neomarinimicrobiota bacterium]
MSWFTRLWGRLILITLRNPYKVKGLDLLDPNENYIFAANHSSSLDIPLLFGCLPYWLVPIAKIELKWIPFLGWAMQAGGHVFIDRNNHEKAMKSMSEIKRSLLAKPR